MLKKLDAQIKTILIQQNLYKFNYADQILEEVFDKIGFTTFQELLKNKDFIEKLQNSDVQVLEDLKNGLWEDNIQKYDEDQKELKEQVTKFYNYLKELILKKK